MDSKTTQIQEKPYRTWLIISIPIIILLIFDQSYAIMDTFLLAKLGNDVIVALGFIAQIYYFIISVGNGIGRAVSSMLARSIGGKEYASLNNIALHGLLVILIVSIASQIIFALFSWPILGLFVPEAQISLVHIYMLSILGGLELIFISEYLVEIMNAEGDTRLSTIIMTLGVFLNITFDYIFIFPCNMHIFGAGLGTVMSYVVTTAIFLYIYLVKKNHIITFNNKEFKYDSGIIREIVRYSIPLIIDALIVSVIGILAVMALNNFAQQITVVAYYLIIRIQTFLFTPLIGLARAGNIVIGHLFGAKRFSDVIKHMNKAIITSLILNVFIILFLIIFINLIIGLFSTDYNVIAETKNIIYIVIFELILLIVIWNCNFGLIAIGRSQNSLYSVIVRLISMIALIFLLCNFFKFGKIGVFLSLILSTLIQSFYSYFIFRHCVLKAAKKG